MSRAPLSSVVFTGCLPFAAFVRFSFVGLCTFGQTRRSRTCQNSSIARTHPRLYSPATPEPSRRKGSAGFHALQKEIEMRRHLFSIPHLSPILLLSVLVLWVPLASAQATRPTQISIELSKPAGSPAAFHQAKVCLFTSYGKPPLHFLPPLSQTRAEPIVLRCSGYQFLLRTNRPVIELAGKPN